MTTTGRVFLELQSALSGRFSIEQELGRGGMGIVYLARDVQLERPVAIKLLAPHLAAHPEMRRRFLREAHLAAQCFHPHIVPIHSVEESGALAWFVMAYVRGESLAERVRRTGPLAPPAVRKLAQDIGWALSYAHQRGLVHRDVKPENILIDASSERFLLADFGIASRQSDEVVVVGEAVGTPRYMAPEQATGDVIDGRADLYALGATLFFAATGRPPFESSSAISLMRHHASSPAPTVRSIVPALSIALGDAIDQCLAKLPAQRPLNAESFVEMIREVEMQNALPPSLLKARANASAAKSLAILSAAVSSTSILLAIGELGHSFGQDLLMNVGVALGAFLAAIAALRGAEAVLATHGALRAGVTQEEAERALSGDESTIVLEQSARVRAAMLIGVGAALAVTQGHLSRMHGLPDLVQGVLQISLLFAPAYLVVRGVNTITSGSRFGRWLHQHIEKPIGKFAARIANAFLPKSIRQPATQFANAPTELRLGRAVEDAFQRLSPENQQLMSDATSVAKALARDAELLRKEDTALIDAERAARQANTDEGRATLLQHVLDHRSKVRARLSTTVSALETLRIDLLRLDSSNPGKSGLTSHLEVVRDLARRVDADAELRRYLAQSTPTPT
ncbi:MAG: serine/threonine-protein kinase [Gemmatimonadaceae bacterium]